MSGVWRHLLTTTVVTRLPASVSGHSLRSGLGSVRRSLLRRLRSVAVQQGTNFFCDSSDSSQISAAETDAACRLHLSYYWGSCLWVTRSRLSPRKKKKKKAIPPSLFQRIQTRGVQAVEGVMGAPSRAFCLWALLLLLGLTESCICF